MDPQFYPKRFDLLSGWYAITNLVYDTSFGLHLYNTGKPLEHRGKAIIHLSELFRGLSKRTNREFDPITSDALTKLYWPEVGTEDLKKEGRDYDDIRSRSKDFAKRLSDFENAGEEGLKKLIEECCELHTIALTHNSRSRYRFAA